MKKINIFPYYISDQPKEQQRYNLLLISEDAENQNIIIARLKT